MFVERRAKSASHRLPWDVLSKECIIISKKGRESSFVFI